MAAYSKQVEKGYDNYGVHFSSRHENHHKHIDVYMFKYMNTVNNNFTWHIRDEYPIHFTTTIGPCTENI